MVDICNTVIGQPFRTWVKEQVQKRNDRLMKDEDWIHVDDDIYEAFHASTHQSRKYHR